MMVQQRVAWFNLAIFGATLAAYGILFPVLGPMRARAAVGLCGLWGFGGLFVRRQRKQSGFVLDERDQIVGLRSQLVGLWVFWECFVAVCMVTWAFLTFYRHQRTIEVDVLPWLVFGGMIVFTVSQSVALLVQYGRSRNIEAQ